jgi:DNA-binding XRE family transcriptional regulator
MSPASVRYYLRKFGIKRRDLREAALIARIKWKKNLPIKEIKRMYCKEKLSLSQIAKIIGVGKETIRRRMIEYGISRRTLSEANSKYPTSPFSGNEIEKYYLIGFRSGDLFVVKSHNKIICSLSTTYPSMIHLFCKLFSKYSHCSKTPKKERLLQSSIGTLKLT